MKLSSDRIVVEIVSRCLSGKGKEQSKVCWLKKAEEKGVGFKHRAVISNNRRVGCVF